MIDFFFLVNDIRRAGEEVFDGGWAGGTRAEISSSYLHIQYKMKKYLADIDKSHTQLRKCNIFGVKHISE